MYANIILMKNPLSRFQRTPVEEVKTFVEVDANGAPPQPEIDLLNNIQLRDGETYSEALDRRSRDTQDAIVESRERWESIVATERDARR